MLLCCIILSSSGKTNASSRRSKKDFWRRCRGVYAKSQHTKYPSQSLSLALHYLPFASRFPLPHSTLAVLFALSLRSPSLSLFASFARFLFSCVLDCLLVTMTLPRFGDLHLKRLEEIESNVRSFMVLQFEHNNFFRNELKEQKSFTSYMNKELDDMSKEFDGLRSQIVKEICPRGNYKVIIYFLIS